MAAEGHRCPHRARSRHGPTVGPDHERRDVDGLEATQRIGNRTSTTRVLILTTFGLTEYVYPLRTEGKAYPVRDGDVFHVLFNV